MQLSVEEQRKYGKVLVAESTLKVIVNILR